MRERFVRSGQQLLRTHDRVERLGGRQGAVNHSVDDYIIGEWIALPAGRIRGSDAEIGRWQGIGECTVRTGGAGGGGKREREDRW
jgi:hypothetical protein